LASTPPRDASPSDSPSEVVPLYHETDTRQDGELVAGFAALKGHDDLTGIDLEMFSVSGETGPVANGAQATMARVGMSGQPSWHPNFFQEVAVSAEAFTAHARIGVENPDGSRGFGLSVGTAVVGAEVSGTLGDGAVSGSMSVSAGFTLEAAIGVRDADRDGRAEICGRLGFAAVTGDLCIEKFF
jgi:hypothetical protein